MSHSYSRVELEARRREQIKKELQLQLKKKREELQKKRQKQMLTNKLQSQIQNVEDAGVKTVAGSKMRTTVFVSDNSVSGMIDDMNVTAPMLELDNDYKSNKRVQHDFSGLLDPKMKRVSIFEEELQTWLEKVEERPIISEKDDHDRTRLLTEIKKITETSKDDREDTIKAIKMRVSAYLQGATILTKEEEERIETNYIDYCALCEMLEVMPVETLPYRVEKELLKMTAVLERRQQDEYIKAVIEDIMNDLGCHFKDNVILDHVSGQVYSPEGNPLCDVFIGNDGDGILFEPIEVEKDENRNDRRQLEDNRNNICSLFTVLEERAAERGVFLTRIGSEPKYEDEMISYSRIHEKGENNKRKKSPIQRQRSVDSEA